MKYAFGNLECSRLVFSIHSVLSLLLFDGIVEISLNVLRRILRLCKLHA